jgi:hypothetical protein
MLTCVGEFYVVIGGGWCEIQLLALPVPISLADLILKLVELFDGLYQMQCGIREHDHVSFQPSNLVHSWNTETSPVRASYFKRID